MTSPESAAPLPRSLAMGTIRRHFIILAVVWSLLIVGLLGWGIQQTSKQTENILLSHVRPFWEQIVVTRSWNARHGSVYVPITSDNPPNPYLKVPNRDVETTSGLKLTMVNPAYMTRQLAELSRKNDNIEFHLTSEHPIRPANAAEPWEAAALQKFKQPGDEFFQLLRNTSSKPIFRYMAPVWFSDACLRCHAALGFKKGDMGGGLSVTLPAKAIINNENESILLQLTGFSLVWLFGMFGLHLASRQIRKQSLEQEELIARLEHTLRGLVPVCSNCKSIRNSNNQWEQMEKYLSEHSEAEFSHGLCPKCSDKLYGSFLDRKN